jgi:hypothetical protein
LKIAVGELNAVKILMRCSPLDLDVVKIKAEQNIVGAVGPHRPVYGSKLSLDLLLYVIDINADRAFWHDEAKLRAKTFICGNDRVKNQGRIGVAIEFRRFLSKKHANIEVLGAVALRRDRICGGSFLAGLQELAKGDHLERCRQENSLVCARPVNRQRHCVVLCIHGCRLRKV